MADRQEDRTYRLEEKADGQKKEYEITRQEQLLSYVAHEIRMPLQTVYGTLQQLRELAGIDEATHAQLESAITQTDYVVELLNDVLDISQIRSGGLRQRIAAASREEFLQFLDRMIAPMLESQGILFECEVQKSPYQYLYLDAQKLQQVLINLVSNAMKHARPALLHGQARVQLHCACEQIEVNRVRLFLTLEDNGEGMEPEVLNQIYTPFLMGRTEEHRRSAGLGMTIVKYLLELLGGNIYLESKPQLGTKATIVLECDGADEYYGKKEAVFGPPKEGLSSQELCRKIKNMRMLVAEDEEAAIDALERDMKTLQIQVDKTYDGEEAVDIFAQSREGYYDILLFDCCMPHKDGLQAAREIRQLQRADSSCVPILIMSGNLDADMHKSTNAGVVTAWLSKPFGKKELQELLCSIWERKSEKTEDEGK